MKHSRASLIIVIAVLAGGLVACGGDEISQEDVDRAAEEAAEKATEEAKAETELAELRKEVRKLQRNQNNNSGGGAAQPPAGAPTGGTQTPPATGGPTTGGGGLPSDAKSCGAGVWARSGTTSCSFALNVASDYFTSGSSRFQSASPSTGRVYTMSCSGFAPVVCTGGNNAAVYIP